jgi:putative ABC transport system substrate-binding protein
VAQRLERRDFITLLGGAAATWPLEARAQQQAMPMIGFLSSASPGGYQNLLIAFRKGLAELGFSEGRNIIVEYRWAEGRFDRLPALAADLVQRDAAVIVTTGIGSALAAKAASATTSLVFLAGDDPVKFGLVASLSRPGGTATGVAWLTSELFTKRLGLVRELVPATALIGVLINPQIAITGTGCVAAAVTSCRCDLEYTMMPAARSAMQAPTIATFAAPRDAILVEASVLRSIALSVRSNLDDGKDQKHRNG